jgi:hypothetical protein
MAPTLVWNIRLKSLTAETEGLKLNYPYTYMFLIVEIYLALKTNCYRTQPQPYNKAEDRLPGSGEVTRYSGSRTRDASIHLHTYIHTTMHQYEWFCGQNDTSSDTGSVRSRKSRGRNGPEMPKDFAFLRTALVASASISADSMTDT